MIFKALDVLNRRNDASEYSYSTKQRDGRILPWITEYLVLLLM